MIIILIEILIIIFIGVLTTSRAQKNLISSDSLVKYLEGSWVGKENSSDSIFRKMEINKYNLSINEEVNNKSHRDYFGVFTIDSTSTNYYSLKIELNNKSTSLRYNTLFLGDITIIDRTHFHAFWYEAFYQGGKQGDMHYFGGVFFELSDVRR